jgi:hypothetical protein
MEKKCHRDIFSSGFFAALTSLSYRRSIKVKVKVQFTLEQATKAERGSRGIAILFNLGAR